MPPKRKNAPTVGTNTDQSPADKQRHTKENTARVSSTRNGSVTLKEIDDEPELVQPSHEETAVPTSPHPNPWLNMTQDELNQVRGKFKECARLTASLTLCCRHTHDQVRCTGLCPLPPANSLTV